MAEDQPVLDGEKFHFAISLSVLNHLGRNLYRNFITVLGEAISNSWDADAKNVWISFDKDADVFFVKDDGIGMDAEQFQKHFLKIGYSKRKDGISNTDTGRPFIGAKGIGKLALLSCAQKITVFTRKTSDAGYVGGTIDNSGLDEAIHDDLEPDDYILEDPEGKLLEGKADGHERGTIIVFEGARDVLRTSEEQIRKLLALSFHFSLIDEDFTIHVNGIPISIDDLKSLTEHTQFVWKINSYDDAFASSFTNLKEQVDAPATDLPISGFLATVEKPSHLNIRGTDQRATVDLFVNGRLREKNILSHLPSQRIVESYVYGQIHFNAMDKDGDTPFTSSREGIVANDENFLALLEYMRAKLFPDVIERWDELRIKHRQGGDDENPRLTVKQRRAVGLVDAAEEEMTDKIVGDQKKIVDGWVEDIRADATFNVEAYADCFLSENLVRKYLVHAAVPMSEPAQKEADKWKDNEATALSEANINFDLRRDVNDLSYLGMRELAINAEGGKAKEGVLTPLYQTSISFKPARDAVGHTGLLTLTAKNHLNVAFENIKGRIVAMLQEMNADGATETLKEEQA